ncbi:hypothetical protein [Fulvivirga lutimaris]|uniref:hypothetical protein n=1 Tax=Fulvivirga lutimaris TaxID=1819566 RepID=UPI0012BD0040|nr:hypothetical protein [Fulvivirga lutimaris]MTI38824.1 hypothetical protein [Fulvivirga lutimaris]
MIGRILKSAIIIILALQVSFVSIFSIHISYLESKEIDTEFIMDFDSSADENTSSKMFELEEEEGSILNHKFWYLESLSDHSMVLTTAFDSHNSYVESHIKEVQSPPPRQLS